MGISKDKRCFDRGRSRVRVAISQFREGLLVTSLFSPINSSPS
jgi:hypothetical protein